MICFRLINWGYHGDFYDNYDGDENSGWSRGRLHFKSGRVQQIPIHPRRLIDNQTEKPKQQWDEVQHKVRDT